MADDLILTQDEIDALLAGEDLAPELSEESEEVEKTKPTSSETPQSFLNELEKVESTNLQLLLDVKVNLSVELGRTKMRVKDVLNIGKGTIIELNRFAGEPVDILVNNVLVARGEVVAVDESFGVKITEIINPDERFKIGL